MPLDLEEEVCQELGLGVESASTQIVQRDRHAFLLSVLAGIAGTLEKMATEIRHLQRSEVAEAEEPFPPGNQGSSAMPHKRNPHASERISGLARLVRGYAVTAAENVALWHERDISHSSTERVILPDAFTIVDFMLDEMSSILEHLVVYPEQMRDNLLVTRGAIYSQPVMLALVDAGMDRQEAYKLLQRHTREALAGGPMLQDALRDDPRVTDRLSPERLEQLFSPEAQLKAVAGIFNRLGLSSRAKEPTSSRQPTTVETTYPMRQHQTHAR